MAVDPQTLLEKTQIINLSETEDKTCPICYEDYLEKSSSELPRKLPCGHILGTECLLLWASSRAKTSSVNCPICTKPIVYATGVHYVLHATSEYVEEVLVRAWSQGARLYTAVDKTLGSRPFFMLILTVTPGIPGLYFENVFTWLPPITLSLFISASTRNRLATHRYRDLRKLLLVVAFLVGTFLDTSIAGVIFFHAIFAFTSMLQKHYVQHDTTVVILAIFAGLALEDARYPIWRMIVDAVEWCIVDCEWSALMDALGM